MVIVKNFINNNLVSMEKCGNIPLKLEKRKKAKEHLFWYMRPMRKRQLDFF